MNALNTFVETRLLEEPCHRCDSVGECGGNSPGLSPLCLLPREVACPCCGAPIALTGAHSCPGCGYSL